MPHLPEGTDPSIWHRYFAVEANNRAWDLAAAPSRSDAESEEMLNAAHAAAFHWNQIGTELNAMRARMLLAEVHALCGLGDSAVTLADAVKDYFLQRNTDDWEIAFVHTIHAHAAAVAADEHSHRSSYQAAKEAIADIADDADRNIVLQTFNQVPQPTT